MFKLDIYTEFGLEHIRMRDFIIYELEERYRCLLYRIHFYYFY